MKKVKNTTKYQIIIKVDNGSIVFDVNEEKFVADEVAQKAKDIGLSVEGEQEKQNFPAERASSAGERSKIDKPKKKK